MRRDRIRASARVSFQENRLHGGSRIGRGAARWIDAGATSVGGCCAVGPDHIAALARMIGKRG